MTVVSDLVRDALIFAWQCVETVLSVLWWPLKVLISFIHVRRHAMKFPVGEKTWPLLGHVLSLIPLDGPDYVKFMYNMGKKNKSGVAWIGVLPLFYVWDPPDVERVLCNSKSQEKPGFYLLAEGLLGKGLVTSSGKLWQRHHKIIAPTFHSKILESFVPIFNSQVDVYIDLLRNHADGKTFNIFHNTERLTIDIICETVMGINLNAQTDLGSEFSEALSTIQECIQQRMVQPWLHPEWAYALTSNCRREKDALLITRRVRDRVIRERKEALRHGELTTAENGQKRRLALLDHLLLSVKAGAQLSDQEIAEQVDTFIVAGADTTSYVISHALFELARYPNVQDKAVKELESLYDASLPTIDVTPEDLSRMTYLEMVLKETLRLHPPVPMVVRRAGEDIRLAKDDLVIPADAQVAVGMLLTHRCADYYSDPDEFYPERFYPENSTDRHPFAFLPFSAGQRMCIGRRLAMLEAKTAVAKVLWRYKFTPEPGFQPIDFWGLTMKPVNGMTLRMHFRR